MRIHDVSPSFIRRLERRGIEHRTAEELIEMKIHGFDRHLDSD
jgi:hypothetical protein